MSVVRHPGVDVDGALSAEQSDRDTVIFAIRLHQAKLNVFVGGMVAWLDLVWVIGDIGDFAAVGRDVWEPVVSAVIGQADLVFAVCIHAAALHIAISNRAEIDMLSVGGIFRSVV